EEEGRGEAMCMLLSTDFEGEVGGVENAAVAWVACDCGCCDRGSGGGSLTGLSRSPPLPSGYTHLDARAWSDNNLPSGNTDRGIGCASTRSAMSHRPQTSA